ncbi:hypothetical protein [Cellulomonas oligotrophica]|uniref:Uncharacterized protein n=2 Tax=Cellulomonas oligotrophica TaxID=931536 RepID=A0A7Y9JZE9_9CELL|nr:hypothetical protein [Cellulomonas oligotrophica]NYD87861.1 hypothetical protein [Cellulomonas oligotrophica]
MRTRTAVMGVVAVAVVAGVATLSVAWAVGAVGWTLVELPGADNDILRELTLAALGAAFLGLGVVGVVVGASARGARPVPGAAVGAAWALAAASLLLAVGGAGIVAARSAADQLSPVLATPDLLDPPAADGRVVVLVAVGLAVAALGVPLVASRRGPAEACPP